LTNYGDTTIEATADSANNAYLITLNKITVPTSVIQGWWVYCGATGNAGNIRFGLYIDNAGAPGNLLGSSDSGSKAIQTAVGWHFYPYTPPLSVAANTYHIAAIPDTNQPNGFYENKASGGTSYYKSGQTYGALPNPFPSSPSSATKTYSSFITDSLGSVQVAAPTVLTPYISDALPFSNRFPKLPFRKFPTLPIRTF
jgi:hypothetical protein